MKDGPPAALRALNDQDAHAAAELLSRDREHGKAVAPIARRRLMATADGFRRLALNLPGVAEGSHMGHADFRVDGKIFAMLGYPDERYATVLLQAQEQDLLVSRNPLGFSLAPGAWGASGYTLLLLRHVATKDLTVAIELAWRRRAPSRLRQELARG